MIVVLLPSKSTRTQLLKTFKKCLSIKNRITPKRNGYTGKKSSCRIQFGNVILYKWLLNIELMPNKTKVIEALKIPNCYFFNFLRGYLDGDGCIRKYQDSIYSNSQRIYVNFSASNLKHLQWIQKTLKHLLKINGYFGKGVGVSILTYAKRESLKLLPHLYYSDTIPYLKRKYKIVQPFLVK